MPEYIFKVADEDDGSRLDVYLTREIAKHDKGLSRTFIQQAIASGHVLAGKASLLKPHHKITSGDNLKVIIDEKKPVELAAEEINLDVVYEDDDVAVINKQEGLVVHPAPGNYEHTLVNALLNRFKKLSDISPERPGIVHRLDKETSGIMVVAKNNAAHLALAGQFAGHTIEKKYIAVVKGRVEYDENVIEVPIVRHPVKRQNMSVGFKDGARYAKTYYRTLKRSDTCSLLELKPFTGRTHQLRVHLAFIGHPILGDKKYGKDAGFGRLALHAESLGFTHPATGKFLKFSTGIPKEFFAFVK